ncbi:hypothetical protein [Polaribacter aestuariivivens]|uniref:hypothetical protein n=1 Tax=Polaribacter aestuariivivens TaxID=2304626 RepID=UPI003F49AB10
MVTFLLPTAIDSFHDYLNHEHKTCISKTEAHIHKKDIDCNLHLLKQSDTFLASQDFKLLVNNVNLDTNYLHYNFLKNHNQLSFSLRGPPSKI